MFVVGGRSTTTEFKDMYALDTEVDPPVWTEVSMPLIAAKGRSFSLCLACIVVSCCQVRRLLGNII